MAYPPTPLGRRNRRRRNLAILLTVAILFSVIALAVRYRTDRRIAIDYLALAEELADDAAVMSNDLADMFASLGDLERPEILERVDILSGESSAMVERLGEAELTPAIAEVHGFFSVAVGSWDRALGELGPAIVEVLDEPEGSPTGGGMLQTAFRNLRVGDRAYAEFVAALDRVDPELVTRDFDSVRFASGERAALYEAPVIAQRLQLILKLEETHNIVITASTNPAPVGPQQDDLPVVPLSEAFSVQAVVTNAGNVGEESILIRLEMRREDLPGEPPLIVQSLVPFLDAGEAKTVDFTDLPVEPGQIHRLRLTATITQDDAAPDDNSWELVFYRNEA
jgi:hypothetical protein